jgi:two-component system chemotaxis sensor kinase CheA
MSDQAAQDENAEIIAEFLVESHEGLDQLDQDLVELERSGTDKELLGRIFRCVHTIKGTCGFLGYEKLESVAHVGENLLSRLREGALAVSPEIATALLGLVDALRQMLRGIEHEGKEGDVDYSVLTATLSRLTDPEALGDATALEAQQTSVDDKPIPALGDILVGTGKVAQADVVAALAEQGTPGGQQLGEILVARGSTTTAAVNEALDTQQEARGASIADGSIRVDVPLLDRLMNLVGELVLTRNQILQSSIASGDAALGGPAQRLNLITTELQEGVMKTRMQPIGNVWNKLPRVVRDLAASLNKQVSIEVEGADTELDKTIIEAIKDPLTHIVRNSVDHGIESPAVRVAAGKSPTGRLFLRAFHEGGMVNIEIRDDGAGIDPARLRAKAVEKGILTADAASRLGERESLNLIFAPGFSTAVRVTNVSGRGVGMDVVKTNIERIGGMVDVTSVPGASTILRIKIPLTLAIIPGLIVTTGGNRYAIPQVSLLELVRLEGDEAKKRIELIYGAPVYRLRGRLLPLIHLNHALGLTGARWNVDDRSVVNIVVLQAEGSSFGVVVDTINDTEEIVVKPLGRQLKGIPAFAGATILGDGRVALILDVLGLANAQNVVSPESERTAADSDGEATKGDAGVQPLLVFALGASHRAAVPLLAVSRLEEFSRDAVERTGRSEVVQYRGDILPLIRLTDVLDGITAAPPTEGPLQVIVYAHNGRSIGFVVDRIVDVVTTAVASARATRTGAVSGTAIVQEKVTDVLDVAALMRRLEPEQAYTVESTNEALAHV